MPDISQEKILSQFLHLKETLSCLMTIEEKDDLEENRLDKELRLYLKKTGLTYPAELNAERLMTARTKHLCVTWDDVQTYVQLLLLHFLDSKEAIVRTHLFHELNVILAYLQQYHALQQIVMDKKNLWQAVGELILEEVDKEFKQSLQNKDKARLERLSACVENVHALILPWNGLNTSSPCEQLLQDAHYFAGTPKRGKQILAGILTVCAVLGAAAALFFLTFAAGAGIPLILGGVGLAIIGLFLAAKGVDIACLAQRSHFSHHLFALSKKVHSKLGANHSIEMIKEAKVDLNHSCV